MSLQDEVLGIVDEMVDEAEQCEDAKSLYGTIHAYAARLREVCGDTEQQKSIRAEEQGSGERDV